MDLAIIMSTVPSVAWGVFTKNRVVGAPVTVSKNRLRSKHISGIVINSGNSNTLTETGLFDANTMANAAANAVGEKLGRFLVASTGIIGQPLPIKSILQEMDNLANVLGPYGGKSAAKAIMTTDSVSKESSKRIKLGLSTVSVGGCAKGSGMIHPNMGTMLAFITTDAAIKKPVLKEIVKRVNQESFSRITVDGDTSTSDMLIIMANGASGAKTIEKPKGKLFGKLLEAVIEVAVNLAKMIVRDGEGATKFATVRVEDAVSEGDAKKASVAIAKSNLVKTALFGQDPNWGRILASAGYSGAKIDIRKATLKINGVIIYKKGKLASQDWEGKVASKMRLKEILIELNLGLGKSSWEIWTCDLSQDYIRINADYRT